MQAHRRAAQLIKRIGGFPHSEICGSKVAHTSPQLIAACHVLLRLYMPRHPRIALTSRLRAHTTTSNAGRRTFCRYACAHQHTVPPPLGKCVEVIFGVDVIISARFSEMNQPCVPQKLPLQAARFPQSRYLHGIDFKNPFTMSKRSQTLHHHNLTVVDLVSSSRKTQCVVEPIGIEPMT